ncbi:MGDG synthase family glycosyltransferase [Paenibacillus tarimensis]|uniref:MGDG synthase family glycosyltransferase n=1 Tax=Paenibacillus tarimensis TaxID=416012 RepID=UPI001F3DA924|nr:glycosyltransferase [Paenibacillus tarimensis]MCF2943413.1 diacylglycerol glucosyltransferase [Paenibacillus tarimensis]
MSLSSLDCNQSFTGKKIMLVYASYGEGHLQAARALQAALEGRGIKQTVMVDLMAEAHPWISAFTRSFYMKSFTLLPGLYGWVYDTTRDMRHNSLFGDWLHSFGRSTMRRLLERERPDAVIHTFPMFVMPTLRSQSDIRKIPSCAVLTDFDLHGRWIHPGIDRLYVPTDDLKQEAIDRGMAADQICASGIPLKSGFDYIEPLPEYRERFGFTEDEPIVLIMAGAQGVMPDVASLCRRLLQHPGLSVALVCGRNAVLARSVRQSLGNAGYGSRLRIFDYVDRIHELMAISTCLVTKPGGITLAEGLAAGLPIFLYRPVPGQERRNAEYLSRMKAAVVCSRPQDLVGEIVKLIRQPDRLHTSKQALAALQKQQAAETIVTDFLRTLRTFEDRGISSPPSPKHRKRLFRLQRGKPGGIQT